MVEKERERAAAERDVTEIAVFKKLKEVGYSGNDANRVIDLARQKAAGKNVTASQDNPFMRNIRISDVTAVSQVLGVKPEDRARRLAVLDVKGPETKLATGKAEAAQQSEKPIKVRIDGDNTYMVTVKPGGDPAKLSDVVSATVRNNVSGLDVNATDAYRTALQNADATAIHVSKPIIPRRVQ